MTSQNAAAADELRAAVRAVERGERTADSFFPPAPASPASPGSPASPDSRGAAAAAAAPSAPGAAPDGVTTLLAAGGAPPSLAAAVVAALGGGAERELRADPWRLLSAPGVSPAQADEFARALLGPGCSPGDERRARALTIWLLERAARAGHTVQAPDALAGGLSQWAVPDPDTAVRQAVDRGDVLVFHDAEGDGDPPGVRSLLGLDRHALAEESLADGLGRLRATFGPGQAAGPAAAAWDAAAAAAPSPAAAELIRAAAAAPLVVHTGGEAARAEPAALVAAARSLGLRAYAAAHAADGRRRLAALLPGGAGEAAVTVAGLLGGAEGPGRDATGLLAADVLAVLDASQLDAETAASLVESLPDGARLVLSGDPLLLGAGGPGRVLGDVLDAGVAPHVASQAQEPGPVGALLAGIGAGELRPVDAPANEVVIVPVRDAGEAVHRAVQLVTDSIPRAFGHGARDVQVIAAGHGGAAGTRALNAALKARLNPGPGRFGGFDVGDRAAYRSAPGHTRLADVEAADADGLRLKDAGGHVIVARDRVADTVRHGWAVTAHQAGGHRWPAAVVVLPGDAGQALDRSWVYTAFSRGERHLSVVQGAGPELARAVSAPPASARTTRLRALLR